MRCKFLSTLMRFHLHDRHPGEEDLLRSSSLEAVYPNCSPIEIMIKIWNYSHLSFNNIYYSHIIYLIADNELYETAS